MLTVLENNQRYIKISDLHVSRTKLTATLELSPNISKYFLTKSFFAEYDKNIADVDKSILVIPILSTIITVAWATGADVIIEKVDRTFLEALNRVEPIFRGWYPQFSFSTKIQVKEITSNKFFNKGCALLFSGGLDSRVSYLRHKGKKPTLISIFGTDVPPNEISFWDIVKKRLINFAKLDGVKISFIRSNAKQIINDNLLSKRYGVTGWWEQVYFGILTLGLCAPLTKNNDIRYILFASSRGRGFDEPWGSHPLVDNALSWADVKVVNDGYELSRQEKIKYVLKDNADYLLDLRVCWVQQKQYNCGLCEKCLRTITGLVLEDIDPNKCGFNIRNGIFDLIKNYFMKGLMPCRGHILLVWQNIQNLIPDEMNDNKLYNSKKFFEWFKNFDLSRYEYNEENPLSRAFSMYYVAVYLARTKGISYVAKRAFNRCMRTHFSTGNR